MEPNVTLLRVRGIPIGIHWTWVIIFVFIIWSLGAAYFPMAVAGLEPSTYYTMAIVTAVLFVISLVLHELGHALQAVKEGMEIEGITLFIFGGVARFKGMFPSAGAEFRIAIAGPLVTAVLLGFFYGLSVLLAAAGAPVEVTAVVEYLAFINGLLLAFNMVPALPLDGGRVLQSYLWRREGNFSAATVQAARSGRAFGTSLIVVGLLLLVVNANLGGIWFAFIGWFLRQAASSEAAFAEFRSALRGLRVRDLMTPDPESVSPGHRITTFIDEVAHPRGHSTYPVISGSELVGLMSLRMAGAMAPERRGMASVQDVMLPREDVPVVDQDADVLDALPALQSGPGRAVVMRNGRVVGILSGSDITRALEVGQVRQPSPEVQESTKRRARRVVWAVILVTVVGAGGLLYRPPLLIVEPGVALDVTGDISIEGVETHEVRGEYLLTSVQLGQRKGFGTLMAFAQGRDVLTIRQIVPPGVDPQEHFEQQRELFRQVQLVAAAAAARAAAPARRKRDG
jgi:Zn-dependent protease/CBS domain-containing protein